MLSEKYKCGLPGEGNFLESSLDNGHFITGDTFLLKRTPKQDDFYHLMNGKFCGEVWNAVSRYVYTALQGGAIMKGWTNCLL